MRDVKNSMRTDAEHTQDMRRIRTPDSDEERRLIEISAKNRHKYRNVEYNIVSVFFVLIFISLIGYLVYFNAAKSETFINSPYNTRQNSFAERVVRGDIISSDGEILAHTNVDENGKETRVYPYSRVFSHVLGFDTHGKSGMELEANFQLLSSHSFLFKKISDELHGKKSVGDTIVSTLDATVQKTAYDALGDRKGAVVAIEPSTGKILAMVSKPDFDPNTLDEDWDYLINNSSNSNLLNRVTDGQYPPGSTFKIVTTLDYMREKGSISKYSFDCEGTITRSGHTIRCYGGHVHGEESFEDAFANSCNTAYASMGADLGYGSLRATSESLMFNHKLPYAASKNSVFSLDKNSGTPLIMQTAIGQGNTLVSPLHMALITCCVANKGVLLQPYLIDAVRNAEGNQISKNHPKVYRRLMSKSEASTLDALMAGVVKNGTASSLSGRSYSVAGKTGSAEFDSNGSSHSWFVGYCGTERADMVVAVIVENGGTGSAAAVPIAGQLFDAYYTSQASRNEESKDVDYTDFENSDSTDKGWFDIVEEDYQEFDPEEFENWEEIFDWDEEEETFPEMNVPNEPEIWEEEPDISIPDSGFGEVEDEPPVYEESDGGDEVIYDQYDEIIEDIPGDEEQIDWQNLEEDELIYGNPEDIE